MGHCIPPAAEGVPAHPGRGGGAGGPPARVADLRPGRAGDRGAQASGGIRMSEVERYLDEMFNRLAGTGAPGRRVLAETEDHLRAAVAAGLAKGLAERQAEHEAVVRFGSAARVAVS